MTDEKKMSIFDATMICEGVYEAADKEEYIAAWQRLIDTGVAWSLQGWFGRNAELMINAGHCHA